MIKKLKKWMLNNSNVLIVLVPIIINIIAIIGKILYIWIDPRRHLELNFQWLQKPFLSPSFIDILQIILIFCTFWVLIRIHGLILVNDKETILLKDYLRNRSTKIDKSEEAIETTTQVIGGTCNQFYIMWLVIWGLFLCYYITSLFFRVMLTYAPATDILEYVQTRNLIHNILNFASSAAMYSMYIILNNVSIRRKLRSDIDNHSFERGIISLLILFFIVIVTSAYGTLLGEATYGKYQFILSLCLAGFSTLSFILLLGKLNSNHLMIPNGLLYGLYLYAMAQIFSPFMDILAEVSGNSGKVELYVNPNLIENDYLAAIFQYFTFFGKAVLTITIIWIAKQYRLMYFVLHKSLSLEQTPIRYKTFRQFMSR